MYSSSSISRRVSYIELRITRNVAPLHSFSAPAHFTLLQPLILNDLEFLVAIKIDIFCCFPTNFDIFDKPNSTNAFIFSILSTSIEYCTNKYIHQFPLCTDSVLHRTLVPLPRLLPSGVWLLKTSNAEACFTNV